MITIESIETKGLETVIKLTLRGKTQTRRYDVFQAGKFLAGIENQAISYKNKATLSNATALKNAYNKKIKTLEIKTDLVEAKVKIKIPESNNLMKINIPVALQPQKEKTAEKETDVSDSLKKLRIYINQKSKGNLKNEKKHLEEYRKKLAEEVKKLSHISGVEYAYSRSKNKNSEKATESVDVVKTRDYTKFSVQELKKMKKRLSLKIEQQNKISTFKAEEQTKRKYKLFETRYRTLIENEERLNKLFNEREEQILDIIDIFSELKNDNGFMTKSTKNRKDSGKVYQSDLFNPNSSTLRTEKELLVVLREIRELFKKQNSINEEGIDPALVDIKLVQEMDSHTEASKKYTEEALGVYRKIFRNDDARKSRLVAKYKRENPEKTADIRNVLAPFDTPYEQLDEKNRKAIERQVNDVIRNILENQGLFNRPAKDTLEIESVEIRKINAKKEMQAALEQAGKDLKKVIKQKVSEYINSKPAKQGRKLTALDFEKIKKSISIKSLTKKFTSKTQISPIGTAPLKGLDNLFSPEETLSVIIYNKENPSKTRFVNYTENFEAPDGWAIRKKSNGEPLIIKEKTQEEKIFRKIRLKKVSVPDEMIKDGIVDNYYGCVIAASFFQILVSNTPLDEEYDYESEEEETRTRNKRLRGKEPDNSGVETTYIKDEWDFQNDVEVFTYKRKRKRHHKPDKDSVRLCWNLHYKGRTFTSKELDEQCMNCFAKKADLQSIESIAQYIHLKTKDSPLTNANFSYDNSNTRWEMLEYGGYSCKDSGPYTGARYGSLYQHGVTKGFSWQAPRGYVRAAEALWNSLAESDFIWSSVAMFLNNAITELDVSKVSSDIMQNLMKYDPDIGSSNYDYKEIYIGRINK